MFLLILSCDNIHCSHWSYHIPTLGSFSPGWAHFSLSRASKVVTLPYTIQPVVMDTDSKMECGWIKHGSLGKVIGLYVQDQSVNTAHKSPWGLFCEAVLILPLLPLIKGLRWGVRTLSSDGRFQSRSYQYLNDLRTTVMFLRVLLMNDHTYTV